GSRVSRAELLLEQDARDEAEPLPADRLGERDHAESEIVRELTHVLGHGPELFELAHPWRKRGPRELGDAVLHESLVFGWLEGDHCEAPTSWKILVMPAQYRITMYRHYAKCKVRLVGCPGRDTRLDKCWGGG